jgi:hypothetical protein
LYLWAFLVTTCTVCGRRVRETNWWDVLNGTTDQEVARSNRAGRTTTPHLWLLPGLTNHAKCHSHLIASSTFELTSNIFFDRQDVGAGLLVRKY